MRKTVSNLIVIVSQLLLVGLFFVLVFNNNITVDSYESVIHNENLDKIATSVSLLFEEEEVQYVAKLEDFTLEELPSADKLNNNIQEEKKEESNINSTPLVSIDASKYTGNSAMGFEVTEGNREYSLSDDEFDVVVAVVAGEFDRNLDDALAVVSVILNRCDSATWSKWAGSSPYSQVTMKGQFEVYFTSNNNISYKRYMPGGSHYGDSKYEIAKQAVIDGLNGIRNNKYLGFRAWYSTNYSDKYIVQGGNRYGYN